MDKKVLSDIEIAQACQLRHIEEIASKIGVDRDDLELFVKYNAKLPLSLFY
jgi:formate--tetrahydrofolate ligase